VKQLTSLVKDLDYLWSKFSLTLVESFVRSMPEEICYPEYFLIP